MLKRRGSTRLGAVGWQLKIVAPLVLSLCPAMVSGQDFDREVAFLTIPTGARIVGLGRAAVSLGADPQSVRWNPAALASLSDVVPVVSSYDGPLDFSVNQLAVAIPLSRLGVIYASAEAQSFGEIPLTTGGSPEETTGSVSPNNLILSLGFARSLMRQLAVGLSVKWLRSELLGDLKGSSVALDAGVLWAPLHRLPLRFGISVTNLGPDLRVDEMGTGSNPLPARLRYGASYDVLGHLRPDGGLQLLMAFDMEHALRNLATASQYIGLELGVRNTLFVRGGLVYETLIETNTGSTLGIGLRVGAVGFDLARELGVNQLGDETHLTLSVRL